MQARFLKYSVNALSSRSERINIQFSNRWLQKFKKFHGFPKIVLHGKKGYADTGAMSESSTGLREKISVYSPENFLNADEFGLWLRLSLDRTIENQQLRGSKKI